MIILSHSTAFGQGVLNVSTLPPSATLRPRANFSVLSSRPSKGNAGLGHMEVFFFLGGSDSLL